MSHYFFEPGQNVPLLSQPQDILSHWVFNLHTSLLQYIMIPFFHPSHLMLDWPDAEVFNVGLARFWSFNCGLARSCSTSWSPVSIPHVWCWIGQILQYIMIPCFHASFERGEGDLLVGGPPAPEQDNDDNVISVFINRIIDPDNPFGTSDSVRILLLQFSSLLVEQASSHIHDAANKWDDRLARLLSVTHIPI